MADRDMMPDANTDLRRLSETDDYQVAEGYPDIRGWDVKTADGKTLGKVNDLIVSISEMRVRYLDVDVDPSLRASVNKATAPTELEDGHALVPIGTVELDDEHDDVLATGLTGDLGSYPQYAGKEITHGYESSLRDRLRRGGAAAGATAGATGVASGAALGATTAPGELYEHEHFDDQKAFAKRRPVSTGLGNESEQSEQSMLLHEEQLDVSTRRVQTGEAAVRKTVDTEHVSQQVPVRREEVTVERRPISGADAANAQIGEAQEIRVPLMREEAVVGKQAVVREEIIVRRKTVTENKTVEADLRKERVQIDGNVASTPERDSIDRPAR